MASRELEAIDHSEILRELVDDLERHGSGTGRWSTFTDEDLRAAWQGCDNANVLMFAALHGPPDALVRAASACVDRAIAAMPTDERVAETRAMLLGPRTASSADEVAIIERTRDALVSSGSARDNAIWCALTAARQVRLPAPRGPVMAIRYAADALSARTGPDDPVELDEDVRSRLLRDFAIIVREHLTCPTMANLLERFRSAGDRKG